MPDPPPPPRVEIRKSSTRSVFSAVSRTAETAAASNALACKRRLLTWPQQGQGPLARSETSQSAVARPITHQRSKLLSACLLSRPTRSDRIRVSRRQVGESDRLITSVRQFESAAAAAAHRLLRSCRNLILGAMLRVTNHLGRIVGSTMRNALAFSACVAPIGLGMVTVRLSPGGDR